MRRREKRGRQGEGAGGLKRPIALPRDTQYTANIFKGGNVQCLHMLFGRCLESCGELIRQKNNQRVYCLHRKGNNIMPVKRKWKKAKSWSVQSEIKKFPRMNPPFLFTGVKIYIYILKCLKWPNVKYTAQWILTCIHTSYQDRQYFQCPQMFIFPP